MSYNKKRCFTRVLVIGQRFHRKAGDGITLSNLFSMFDPDCLFSLPLQSGESLYDICRNVYEIDPQEVRQYCTLLRVLKRTHKLSFINSENCLQTHSLSSKKTNCEQKNTWYKSLKRTVLQITGLYHITSKYVISDKLATWLQSINIDVIYAQFSNLATMRIVIDITQLLNKPLVIHIMDDWISFVVKPSLLSYYLTNKYRVQFTKILSISSARIAISESMAIEYKLRYNYNFYWVHNPIEPEQWKLSALAPSNSTMIIGYFGGVGISNKDSLYDIARAIDSINSPLIKLKVFTNDANRLNKKIFNFICFELHSAVDFIKYQQEISRCALLILPFGFSKDSVSFTLLSIPTKLSEYMVSRIPILVYAPKESALYKYCFQYSCATLIGNRDVNLIRECILSLMNNPEPFNKKAEVAYQIAVNTLSKESMQNRLNEIFHIAIQEGYNNYQTIHSSLI